MRLHRVLGALAGALTVMGCSVGSDWATFDHGGGSLPVLDGASVTENRTPVDDALLCYGELLSRERGRHPPTSIGVGEVRDFTGRVTDIEGAPVTQGAALMVYSALANLGPQVRIHERLDPRVAELELSYIDRQRLGDGRMHEATPGADPAPWLPYMGGSILQSDYFIVGGVTELNYSLSTGGIEATIRGIGLRSRYLVINVAVDLRVVNTRNLVVEHAVSMQKQVLGREVGGDVFRFFGTRLFDVYGGQSMSEPLQMAVRSVLQLATLDLLEAVTDVPNEACVRKVQPDTKRGLPRPGTPSTRKWPPDSGTAVSAEHPRKIVAPRADPRASQDRLTETPSSQSVPDAKSATNSAQPMPSDTGAVVVGAATNPEAATEFWRRLRNNNPQLFADVQADMISVNREGGPFLVVVQHPRIPAAAFCLSAEAVGIECAVAPPEVIAARSAARRAN